MKSDHRSEFSNWSNWKEEAWKNQGFNGIRTRGPRDTVAMLYKMSYARKPHIGMEVNLLSWYLPWGVKWCDYYLMAKIEDLQSYLKAEKWAQILLIPDKLPKVQQMTDA